jgi:hypothetical protein
MPSLYVSNSYGFSLYYIDRKQSEASQGANNIGCNPYILVSIYFRVIYSDNFYKNIEVLGKVVLYFKKCNL